jgi:hypothetical protein
VQLVDFSVSGFDYHRRRTMAPKPHQAALPDEPLEESDHNSLDTSSPPHDVLERMLELMALIDEHDADSSAQGQRDAHRNAPLDRPSSIPV